MTLIYFILILGITIFIHELGHFIFAKRAGAHIYEFSLGMGPVLLRKKRKNDPTEYCLRLLPIGGFVAIAGEDSEDKDIPKEKQLLYRPWHHRFLTMIAGILFNFLLAFVLLFIVGCTVGVLKHPATVESIESGYPLEATSMRSGDKIIKVNHKRITSNDKLTFLLLVNGEKEATFTVKHPNGTIEEMTVSPIKVEEEKEVSYRFGLVLNTETTKDLKALLLYPFQKTYSLIEQMVLILGNLITGKLHFSNLSGPVGIYSVVGETSKAGFINLVYLTAYLCINVGFINAIPFPAFDGGRAFFLLIEKMRRKPINPQVENTIHTIGFYFLMLLMILITYNDILKLLR